MSKDPLQWCGDLAWYLTERDADCGYRSSWEPMVAVAQGSTGSGGSGAERWLHMTSRYGAKSPIARDRVLRRLWAALSAYHRDVLSAYYTGRMLWSNGEHAQLGRLGKLAPVAVFLAKLAGTEAKLLRALSKDGNGVWVPDAETTKTLRESARAEVRAAHQAYYDLLAPLDDDDDDGPDDVLESLAETTGVYSVSNAVVQREGRWVQR